MTAFERILSGMPGMDAALDSIRLGDNVVWQISDMDEFKVFAEQFAKQAAWYTDLMMGNFFRVTCPYLFILDTVAYFPLIRGRHSQDTVAAIRDTTQLMLDVCSDDRTFYLHPLKVWKRYSDTMFMVHAADRECLDFHVLNNGVEISRYYALVEELANDQSDSSLDSHDRFFMLAKMKSEQGELDKDMEDLIISSTLTKDKRLKEIIKKYFRPKDYFRLKNRMVGSGAIGGKACGMLLAILVLKMELEDYRQLACLCGRIKRCDYGRKLLAGD